MDIGSDTEECSEPPTKKTKYNRKWKDEWLLMSEYRSWLTKRYDSAFCSVCNVKLSAGIYFFKRHSETASHIVLVKELESTPKISQFTQQTSEFKKLKDQQYSSELKIAMFVAEHNISFNVLEHLPQLIRSCAPDSNIMKHVTCGRTKGTRLITNVIGPQNTVSIQLDLSDGLTPYSLVIDETTDVSTKKVMAVIIRYFREDNGKVIDRFLELVECSDGKAAAIYDEIKICLEKNKIPFESMIGFGSDNCPTMMGSNNSVKSRILTDIPHIFISGCSSHLIHLCAVAASSRLPSYVEELTRDIFSHFSFSTKRREEFVEYQAFLDLKQHNFLRAGQTRWLSLEVLLYKI